MNLPFTLAMTVYRSWTDRVFSAHGFEVLLVLGMFVASIMVPLLARRCSADSPYFSGVFWLALCPLLFAAIIALRRILSAADDERLDPIWVVTEGRFARQIVVFGGALTIFAVVIYSAIRAAARRYARLHSGFPIPKNNVPD
ncbi:MAG: hypothetical protein ABMA01_21165 [Chthoniobacteraceae bacterium]